MRPPWSIDEARFLDTCSRCLDCVSACPERVLGRGDGGFPEIIQGAGECSFCGSCVTACAPAALVRSDAAPWAWTARIADDCLMRAGIVCYSCRDVCPQRAISLPMGRAIALPSIDIDRCTGCGACVGPCPSSAIQMKEAPHHE
jgi:ferredoxin-type protein NapF